MGEAQLASLVKVRGRIKGKLTSFAKFIQRCKEEEDKRSQLPSRLGKISEVWSEFDITQTAIDDIDDGSDQEDERETFEDLYHELITEARNLCAVDPINTRQNQVPILNPPADHISVKLPVIDLPKFNGDFRKWISFKDVFNSLIDANQKLSSARKLHYLKSALSGEAAALIETLEVVNDNYTVAWDLLKKRFDKKRKIVEYHTQAILNLPVLQRESHSNLRQSLNDVTKNLEILKKLEQPIDTWDTLIIQILTPKLDSTTLREWEKERASKEEIPQLKEFTEFLSNRCSFLESIVRSKPNENSSSSSKGKGRVNYTSVQLTQKPANAPYSYVASSDTSCVICQGQHRLFKCNVFRNLPVHARYHEVKNRKLCRNCLNPFHGVNCTSGACKLCKRQHHTLLHTDALGSNENRTETNRVLPENSDVAATASKNTPSVDKHTPVSVLNIADNTVAYKATTNTQYVLLSTAVIFVKDATGSSHECRALLDSGSQSNLMTLELSERLQLPKRKIDISIHGISRTSIHINHMASTTIQSKYNGFNEILTFLTMPKITDKLPMITLDTRCMMIPSNIRLADPSFNQPNNIDILLGANIFWNLLCIGQIRTSPQQPMFQKTKLGWIVSGALNMTDGTHSPLSLHCCFSSTGDLHQQLEKFWEVEELQVPTKLTKQEQLCEGHFSTSYTYDTTGRCIVKLPFKSSPTALGDSKGMAIKRLHAVERRLEKNKELKDLYHTFKSEYEQLNHMTEVQDDDIKNGIYYLPHDPVIKETDRTMKIRVVSDGSCATSTGVSLNEILSVGPTIQQDLTSIVLQFRQPRFALSADVTKMYRQILVHPDQRDLQRILWRWDRKSPIKTFQLNTVTYGLASSPYLAIRCLHQAALNCTNKYPEASQIMLRDFYVDDLLTGNDDISELQRLKVEIITILQTCQFKLSKWKSNAPGLLDAENTADSTVNIGQETKVLGLIWNTSDDTLIYEFNPMVTSRKVTKRIMLSSISQIFDPLGLIGPIIVQGKIMLQQIWQLKIGWDESVPLDLHSRWLRWLEQIESISEKRVPRMVLCVSPLQVEIHGFCDASEVAYEACIYIRSIDSHDTCKVQLYAAKSRVAPLKNLSLPKLELCEALLLASLCHKLMELMRIHIHEMHYWCDSSIVLAWISSEPHRWNTFVANRVSEIQRLTDKTCWHHVRSASNPADVISRGINPEGLPECRLWWEGQEWLHHPQITYPTLDQSELTGVPIPEIKKPRIMTFTTNTSDSIDIFSSFSSLVKLKNVTAYCMRFLWNYKHPESRIVGPLTVSELDASSLCLIRMVQAETFKQESQDLRERKLVHNRSKMSSLDPFLDEDHIIRVGGRLKRAAMEYSSRHPIILPCKHPFTTLLIRYEHYRQLHAGTQASIANLRVNYWILSARRSVRSVLRKCIVCFRARPIKFEQLMGDLPMSRIRPSKAFLISGVDYAGPFPIKISRNVTGKAYLCLFICLATRAIHLELVSSLSTESFLNALKRFIARRGRCHTLNSDNGSNFVGAARVLKDLIQKLPSQSIVSDFLTQESITWRFIPSYSPHMDGIWEAGVKSAKGHLKRVLGSTLLTFEELYTFFPQVESCSNSRPLTPISNDPLDLEPLTPSHFLTGGPSVTVPEEDLSNTPANRLTRWGLLTQLRQHFWTRWTKEYVSLLQQRNVWRKINDNIAPGMMILLQDDQTSSMAWPSGRIVSLHPGHDGVVRVVTIRTRNGITQRAVSKIYVLPIDDNDELSEIRN